MFKNGDKVVFKKSANVFYAIPGGEKQKLSDTQRNTVWNVEEIESNYWLKKTFIVLISNLGKIKVRETDIEFANKINNTETKMKNSHFSNYGKYNSSSSVRKESTNMLKLGDYAKFKPGVKHYYNAISGDKIQITPEMRNTIWRFDAYDYYNEDSGYFSLGRESIRTQISNMELASETSQQSKPEANPVNKAVPKKNYNGYQFTALGLSGSGKTSFMAGMYYKMTGGIAGYTLKASDDDDVMLTSYYEQMNNPDLGADRFPGGTNQSTEYSFDLQYSYKTLEKFKWIDYAGGVLKSKNSGDAEEFQQLKDDIAKSEMLYIFVDGGLFLDDEVQYADSDKMKIEILTDIVQDNCARQVNHFLSEYTAERDKLPPIAIVVTKYDIACQALGKVSGSENQEMLYQIIQRAFNPLFPDPSMFRGDDGHTSMVGIIPVSLGFKISENGYTGKLRPINMHMPAYVGIWFMMKNSNSGQDTAIKKLSDEIEDSGIKFWLDGQTGKFSTLAEGYLKKIKER